MTNETNKAIEALEKVEAVEDKALNRCAEHITLLQKDVKKYKDDLALAKEALQIMRFYNKPYDGRPRFQEQEAANRVFEICEQLGINEKEK